MSFKYIYCNLLLCIFLSEAALTILNGSRLQDHADFTMVSMETATEDEIETRTNVKESTLTSPKADSLIVTTDTIESNTTTTKKTKRTSFKPSIMPKVLRFSSKYCTTHPQRDSIDLSNSHFKHLPTNIFNACTKVSEINLSRNQLSTIPSNAFEFNDRVEFLNLSDNALKEVDPNWFNAFSGRLRTLDLSKNLLETFPLEQILVMPNLRHLILSENHLHDIDEHKVMAKFEYLKHIELYHNKIGCQRHKALNKYFTDQGINVTQTLKNSNGSKLILGCIDNGIWTYRQLTLVMEDLDTANEMIKSLTLGMIVIGSVFFVLILMISGCCILFFFKLRPIMNKISGLPNRSIRTDLGEYYNPNEEFEETSVHNYNNSNPEAEGSKDVYATIDKKAKTVTAETIV